MAVSTAKILLTNIKLEVTLFSVHFWTSDGTFGL